MVSLEALLKLCTIRIGLREHAARYGGGYLYHNIPKPKLLTQRIKYQFFLVSRSYQVSNEESFLSLVESDQTREAQPSSGPW